MFRTELPLTPHPHQLPLTARVLTIGSCFSDTIGSRLADFKVAAMVNPFGTVFNPISLCKLLRAAAGEDMDWQQHLVEARGRWQSYDLHAELGAESPVELLQRIQELTREVGVFLATADTVVLTLGTAYAYRLRETQEIVSNCHKLPAEKFDKELLTADDIIAAVAETHAYLRRINPRLRFILTVSPVRHLKDTLVLNSASKAMLRVACHYLSELLPDVSYFPAYELLVDDLRDYRFYAADMLHPSEVAENYIWERFTRTYFDAAFGRFKKEWEGIRQALHHRPLYAAAPEHRQFLESTLERLRRLGAQADVRMELLHLERELAALPLPPPPPAPEPEEIDDDEERIDIGEPEEADEPTARLVEPGVGLLIEAETTEETEEETEKEISPESAYEHAYTAALDDDDEEEATEPAADAEEPVRRKKRRSRGGAKRTKRKHARLAAEAAAQQVPSTGLTEAVEETAPAASAAVSEESTPTPTETAASEVVYVTEAQLRQPRPAPEPVPAEAKAKAEAEAPIDAGPAETAKRSRNNRRGNRAERPAREASRTTRRPLYAPEAPAEAPATDVAAVLPPAPAETTRPEPAVEPASLPAPPQPEAGAPEVFPVAEASSPEADRPAPRKAPARPRASRSKKPAAPAPEAAPTPEPSTAASESAATPVPEANPAPAKSRTRRRPTAAAEPAPVATPAEEAAPATPAPKRASRRKTTPAPEPPAAAPEPTPSPTPEPAEAAPKRRARPPRRKPAADTPPENA